MHAIEDSVVVLVSCSLSVCITLGLPWLLRRKAKVEDQFVDNQGEAAAVQMQCGACQSPVLADKPLTVVLSSTGSFKVFRCQQCGTNLTVPI